VVAFPNNPRISATFVPPGRRRSWLHLCARPHPTVPQGLEPDRQSPSEDFQRTFLS
ncbi:hypothetical protein XENOCAPTIV_026154, partial [Xenoophorus captivus]